jgi:hypothetical protein
MWRAKYLTWGIRVDDPVRTKAESQAAALPFLKVRTARLGRAILPVIALPGRSPISSLPAILEKKRGEARPAVSRATVLAMLAALERFLSPLATVVEAHEVFLVESGRPPPCVDMRTPANSARGRAHSSRW